uniref:Uncharacterized protein n=1 Tax=Salix viminalis TaxID=40686 RepID=A0A6N2LP48_SALVM
MFFPNKYPISVLSQ